MNQSREKRLSYLKKKNTHLWILFFQSILFYSTNSVCFFFFDEPAKMLALKSECEQHQLRYELTGKVLHFSSSFITSFRVINFFSFFSFSLPSIHIARLNSFTFEKIRGNEKVEVAINVQEQQTKKKRKWNKAFYSRFLNYDE